MDQTPQNVINKQGKGGSVVVPAGCTIGGFIGDYVGDLFGYTSIEKLQPQIEIISPEAQKKFNKTHLNLEIERS